MNTLIPLWAILRESLLSLRAQGLFKLTMAVNVMVIVAFASIGFTDTGVSYLYGLGEVKNEYIYAGSLWSSILYLGIFSAVIVNVWLAWVATGLALVSTSSIFPGFISEGAVELTMSRPVSRGMIFLAKYLSGLLFVLLQVTVFSVGAFLAAGWRIDLWDPSILLAIPLVTLFYSYLFCVNVLVGIWTRSTLTALILTIMFWGATFSVRTADYVVTAYSYTLEAEIDQADKGIGQAMAALDKAQGPQVDRLHKQLTDDQKHLQSLQDGLDTVRVWQVSLERARWFVPETGATIDLLRRSLESDPTATIASLMSGDAFRDKDSRPKNLEDLSEDKADVRELTRPWWKILGKSLLFEAVVLALAFWTFRRRDY